MVKVGLDAKNYHMHKTSLKHCSGFSRGIFDGVVMIENTEMVTEAFVDWVIHYKIEFAVGTFETFADPFCNRKPEFEVRLYQHSLDEPCVTRKNRYVWHAGMYS